MYRVLAVDDEPDVRELMRSALLSRGIACDLASDGEEAYELCRQSPYQAVVTDLRMPQRHGHALAADLLGLPSPPRVLVVTGLAEPRLVQDLKMRGVEDIIFKPLDYDALAIKISAMAAESGVSRRHPSQVATVRLQSALKDLRPIEEALAEISRGYGDALEGLFEPPLGLRSPPSSVNEFIARLAIEEELEKKASWKGERRREFPRAYTKVVALASPICEELKPVGDPFKVAVRDVSEGGVRLLHTRSTVCTHLALRWTAQTDPANSLSLVGRMTRCRPLGPFYDIGCRFLPASFLPCLSQNIVAPD